MSGKFITNKEKVLKETIKNILPTSEKIDILVGFFYFSGFNKLYDDLKDKKMRVLIGMDIEIDIRNSLKEFYKYEKGNTENSKAEFIEQLKNAFNKTDIFDNEDTKKASEIFIDKIIDKSLEIRKTRDPNHSKLYLFYENENSNHSGDRPGTLITGSSNFSYAGLEGRHELNARFDDKQSFDEGVEFFEELWEDSVEITTGGEDDEIVKVLKEKTWLKIPSPYEAYIRVLSEYFDINIRDFITPSELTSGKIKDLDYQIEAIKKGLNIINEHSGVIIADVVGLGKSIIGSTLIANLGKKAMVICPPHLVKQWENYGEDFGLNLKIFSSGKIRGAFEFNLKYRDKYGVILIDEAHRYRTSENIDYGNLIQITQGKKVILLTATPFNNSPEDIFNLIKLFQIPKKSTIQTGKLLIYEFQELIKEYNKIRKDEKDKKIKKDDLKRKLEEISAKIKFLIYPVVIRRSRVDLEKIETYKKDLENQGYEYSKVNKPKTLEYNLGNLENLYIETIESLLTASEINIKKKGFTCARYTPLLYLQKEFLEKGDYREKFYNIYGYHITRIQERQKNMNLFITRLIVARFESSIGSFKKTINNIIQNYENYEKWIKIGKIPIIGRGVLKNLEELDFSDLEGEFFDQDDNLNLEEVKKLSNDEINARLKNDDGFIINLEHLDKSFVENFNNDLEFLKSLKSEWEKVNNNPKLEAFADEIKKDLKMEPNRKIVIFSQFSDTVNEIYDYLQKKGVKIMKGEKTKKGVGDLMKNFDAGLDKKDQKNDFDVVVATDAISEGYNLHRAGTIYNYDIPYNPTIVIQRIGRINRINKKVFEELNIFNFFPSLIGGKIVRTESIAKLKVSMINFILGTDTRTLDENEDLDSFYSNIIQEDDSYNEEKSWDTDFDNELKNIKKNDKEFYIKAHNLPQRTRLRRESIRNKDFIIIFARKGGVILFKIIDKKTGESKVLSIEEAFKIFKAVKEEVGFETSSSFYKFYNQVKKELFKPEVEGKSDPQIVKTLQNLKKFERDFENEYFKLLEDSVRKLGIIPDIYLKIIRELTPENRMEKITELERNLSIESLKNFVEKAYSFDGRQEELIISEEF